jgi:hypothetical protein
MSGKFKFAVQDKGAEVLVAFHGIIDEDVDFSQVPVERRSAYIFNFDGVKGINSCGIREWVKFSERFDPATKLIYQNCTQIIIEQINMVAGFFRAGSEVRNFYAPYFCETCDEERKVLIDAGKVSANAAPAMACASCGETMEFDALEEQYFRFLKMTA